MSSFFDKLPDINFAEKDAALIEAEIMSYFENRLGIKLHPANPKRLMLLVFVKYLALQRSLIDFSGKQNLLRYATEGFLQNLGALLGVEILEPSPAITTLKFTLSTVLPGATTIRKGTRATPGNNIHFATTHDVDIPAGELSVTVQATCTQVGEIGNDYYPGQINRLSDPFPYSYSIENITLTQGGSDRESLDDFRERIRIAPESFSTAGPGGAYIFWARSASPLISDVSVVSPSPGVVEIVPLLKNGDIPTQALLDDVYAECSDSTRRPLTDMVLVRAPEPVKYSIKFKYFILRRDSAVGLSIQHKVLEAVEKYIAWQNAALGRDINPSKLIEIVMESGVKRVEITEPTFKTLKYYEVAISDMENILDSAIYGGLEDD